jgi:hypothetical protein
VGSEITEFSLFQTVKISFFKRSKFPFSNCQNFPFQTVKISLFKLSKFPFSNCQNFPFQTVKISPFQTVKISLFKLSKFPFSNCQNFLFQTVKISLFKLSKFLFSNCQNFPFQTVKISLKIPGNLITIIALLKCQRLRKHPTTYFLLSLTVSDFIFCMISMPMQSVRYFNKAWIFGDTLCKIFPLVLYSNIAISTLSMILMTLNRHCLISFQQYYARIYRKSLIWAQLVVAWSLAIFMMVSEKFYRYRFSILIILPVLCFESFTGSLF